MDNSSAKNKLTDLMSKTFDRRHRLALSSSVQSQLATGEALDVERDHDLDLSSVLLWCARVGLVL